MKYLKITLVFLLIVGFAACTKRKSDTDKEVKRVESIEKVYITCDSLEEISKQQETGSISENEYGRKMERAMCEKAKLMRGLTNEDKLLVEYEAAKRSLVGASMEGKEHPALYKDKQFVMKANKKMEKVREYYCQLMKVSLSSDQRTRFDAITKIKI